MRRILLDGKHYFFKPPREENEERNAYSPEDELEVYEKFKKLQGSCIPICYGIITFKNEEGLLVEDCGPMTLLKQPDDENSKFLL